MPPQGSAAVRFADGPLHAAARARRPASDLRSATWPWHNAPRDCVDYDAAVWFAVRETCARAGGPIMPRQDRNTWVAEQRASRSHDRSAAPAALPARPVVELIALLRAVAEESEPNELDTFAFQAAWAIDKDPRLAKVDRGDAHRRLDLAVAHARQRHARAVSA